jgi:hypothetical protein
MLPWLLLLLLISAKRKKRGSATALSHVLIDGRQQLIFTTDLYC